MPKSRVHEEEDSLYVKVKNPTRRIRISPRLAKKRGIKRGDLVNFGINSRGVFVFKGKIDQPVATAMG